MAEIKLNKNGQTNKSKSVSPTYEPTLIEITSQRPDVLGEASKKGGDPYTAGTAANTWLNDWYNRVGKAEGADMASKGLFDKPAETEPLVNVVSPPKAPKVELDKDYKIDRKDDAKSLYGRAAQVPKTTRSLIDIANSRPDVLEVAKAQGGDPFTAGTAANTWLNNWWNTAGKNEFPDVTLGPPTDEPTQFTDEANDFQEKLFDSLPKTDDDEIDVRESKKLLDDIMDEDEDDDGLAPPPSMANLFKTTKETLGMEPLEEDLARIDSEIDIIESELLIQQGELTGGQELVTSRQLSRRKGTLQKEADDRILRLKIEKGIVSRQLNNKINSLNMIMQFSQQDYTNSAAYYKTEFDKAVQIYDLVSGEEKIERTIEQEAEDDARTNWSVIYNAISEGQMDYDSLSDDNKIKIRQLELEANFPIGMMNNLKLESPDQDILTTTSRTDASGGQWFDVLMQDKNGEMTVKSVYKGAGEVGGVGGAGVGITTPEGEEIDITTAEGIANAIKNGENPANLKKRLDTEYKDISVSSINDLINAGTSLYIRDKLSENIGKDDYVNTAVYLDLKQKYPDAFKPFATPEAVKSLINPKDLTAQGIKGVKLFEEKTDEDKMLEEFLKGEKKDEDKQGFWGSVGVISNWLRGK